VAEARVTTRYSRHRREVDDDADEAGPHISRRKREGRGASGRGASWAGPSFESEGGGAWAEAGSGRGGGPR
jgi:hypothetical protein